MFAVAFDEHLRRETLNFWFVYHLVATVLLPIDQQNVTVANGLRSMIKLPPRALATLGVDEKARRVPSVAS
jgi:hypothetical protein